MDIDAGPPAPSRRSSQRKKKAEKKKTAEKEKVVKKDDPAAAISANPITRLDDSWADTALRAPALFEFGGGFGACGTAASAPAARKRPQPVPDLMALEPFSTTLATIVDVSAAACAAAHPCSSTGWVPIISSRCTLCGMPANQYSPSGLTGCVVTVTEYNQEDDSWTVSDVYGKPYRVKQENLKPVAPFPPT